MNSALYTGSVRHRRFTPKPLSFSYPLYMLALDLDELSELSAMSWYFRCEGFAPLSFRRADYPGNPTRPLKLAVLDEVQRLGGETDRLQRVVMLGQVRCFGIYFSPVNFFFCYPADGPARYMLAEVRNTPWRERHCYLVDLNHTAQPTPKAFHVSPFMDMAMEYHWRVSAPDSGHSRTLVHIENHRTGQTKSATQKEQTEQPEQNRPCFDATLTLKRQPFTTRALGAALRQWPLMSLSIVRGIYWQVLRLVRHRIPFHPHP